MKVKVFPKKFLYSTKKNWPKYLYTSKHLSKAIFL